VAVGVHRRQLSPALERRRSGKRLVGDAGKRVDVGAGIDGATRDLLGGDVADGSQHLPGLGQLALARDQAADSEVAEEHPLALAGMFEEDVRRLDVAVYESGVVGGVEGARELGD
jgi:hypothetical protein